MLNQSLNKNLEEKLLDVLKTKVVYQGNQIAFAGGKLGVDLSGYDYYELICYISADTTSKQMLSTGKIKVGWDCHPNYDGNLYRNYTYSNGDLVASNGYLGTGVNNNVLPPFQVIAYKK